MTRAGDPPRLFDGVPFEGPIDDPRAQVSQPDTVRPRDWRRALGWSATSAPVAFLLVTGIVLGPQGISLMPQSLLLSLVPVIPVAVAALGVLVGLGVADRRAVDRKVFAAACLDVGVSMVVVWVGIALVLLWVVPAFTPSSSWALLLAGSVCAATSLTLPRGDPLEPRSIVARVTELGVLLPVVVGGLVLAWLRAGSFIGSLALVVQATVVTLTLAAATWLLLTRTTSETEERVFAVAALLLVGGVADALSLSALLGGLVAGFFWRVAGNRPRETIRRDVLFVQHPLLVVVLLVAGARAELTLISLTLGAGYLLLRVVGTLVGGLLAVRVLGEKAPQDLWLHRLRPGAFGVAYALNAVAIVGAEASVLLTAVVVGTIGSELVAFLLPPRSVDE